jgi:hypothetical protein
MYDVKSNLIIGFHGCDRNVLQWANEKRERGGLAEPAVIEPPWFNYHPVSFHCPCSHSNHHFYPAAACQQNPSYYPPFACQP